MWRSSPFSLPQRSTAVRRDSPCQILDLEGKKMNCYIKDVNFDAQGHPMESNVAFLREKTATILKF